MGGRGGKKVGHMGRHRKSIGAHGKSRMMKKRPGTWPAAGGNIVRHAAKHTNGNEARGLTTWALVIGDPFISATIPAFVRFVFPRLVRASAHSPLCAVWVTLLNPLENPTLVLDQLLGNYPSREPK